MPKPVDFPGILGGHFSPFVAVVPDLHAKESRSLIASMIDAVTLQGRQFQNIEASVYLGPVPVKERPFKKELPREREIVDEIVDEYFRGSGIFYDPFVQMYLRDVSRRQLNSEQRDLLFDRIKAGDQSQKDKFLEANLKLVVWVAKKYIYHEHRRKMGDHFLDIVQAGNLGLMRALDKFDFKREGKFSTYAVWHVHKHIAGYLQKQTQTSSAAHLLLNTFDALSQDLRRAPTFDEVAREMFPMKREVRKALRKIKGEVTPEIRRQVTLECEKKVMTRVDRLIKEHQRPVSLDLPVLEEEDPYLINDSKRYSLGDLIEDRRHTRVVEGEVNARSSLLTSEIMPLLKTLTPRQREIVELRTGLADGDIHSLREIGENFGISKERVRQIYEAALQSLKRAFPRFEGLTQPLQGQENLAPNIDTAALLDCNKEFIAGYREFKRRFEILEMGTQRAFLRKLGEVVQELCTKKNYGLFDLAAALNVRQHWIRDWEAGGGGLPGERILLKLAYFLNFPARQMLKAADFELMDRLWPVRFEGKAVWRSDLSEGIQDALCIGGRVEILHRHARLTSYDLAGNCRERKLAEIGLTDNSLFSRDGGLVAVIGAESGLFLIDVGSGNKTKLADSRDQDLNRLISLGTILALSGDNTLLAVGGRSGILLFNTKNGALAKKILLPDSELFPQSLAVSPDNRMLAVAMGGSGVRIYELSTGRCIKTKDMGGARHRIYEVAYSPDGENLAVAHSHGFCLFDSMTLDYLEKRSERTGSVDFSSDGRFLVRGCEGFIEFLQRDNGQSAVSIPTIPYWLAVKINLSSNLSHVASVQQSPWSRIRQVVVHQLKRIS